jgi:hypothetical protein
MSEFTECYQLLADDVADGVALLERAGLPGWAFPPRDGWVTVVVERPYTTEPDPPLIAANQGVLLLFVNAEDHGWSLTLWEGPDERSHYQAEWELDIEVDASRLDLDAFRRLVGPAVPGERMDAVVAALGSPPEFDAVRWVTEGNPAQQVAGLLGLPNAEWISGEQLGDGEDDRAAEATYVNG